MDAAVTRRARSLGRSLHPAESPGQPLEDVLALQAVVEVAEDEEGQSAVSCGVLRQVVEEVPERHVPVAAVDRRRCLHGDEVTGVVEQVHVDQVDGGAAQPPARAQEALPGPAPVCKEGQRELVLLHQGEEVGA